MSKPRLVFFASGEGHLFKATVDYLKQTKANVEVVGLVTQNASAGCVVKAREWDIEVICIPFKKTELNRYEDSLLKALAELRPTLIVLLGFTRQIPEKVVKKFKGQMINSHPSLLPKYGGQGMYGRKVHEAVFAAKEMYTGVSIHLVDENYDEGQVLAQQSWDISAFESAEAIEDFIKAKEREFFPRALLEMLGDRWGDRCGPTFC